MKLHSKRAKLKTTLEKVLVKVGGICCIVLFVVYLAIQYKNSASEVTLNEKVTSLEMCLDSGTTLETSEDSGTTLETSEDSGTTLETSVVGLRSLITEWRPFVTRPSPSVGRWIH